MEDRNSGGGGGGSASASSSSSGSFSSYRDMDPAEFSARLLQGMADEGLVMADDMEVEQQQEEEEDKEDVVDEAGSASQIVAEELLASASSGVRSVVAVNGQIAADEIQHKRAKVLDCASSSGHVQGAPSELIGSASMFGLEFTTTDPVSSRTSCLAVLLDDNGGQVPMESGTDNDVGDYDDDDKISIDSREDSEIRMDLTDDLLHMVFSFLDQQDLCQAAMVCRQWRAASSHEDFWRSLNFEKRNISRQQVAQMCRKYPRATKLNLRGAPLGDELVREAMLSLRHLEVLVLGDVPLSEGLFGGLVSFPVLHQLTIIDATLGNGTQEIQVSHDTLRNLQIAKCRVIRVSIRCPQLEILSLKRSTMCHALLTCPQLRELDVASCNKLSDAGVRVAATSCPLLSSLDMSKCSSVSDETLREIANACSNLRVLDASYCPNISLEAVRLPRLSEMRLLSCEGINASSMASLSHCLMLETLKLDLCWLLTSVSLDLPHLQNISLVNCKKFVELNLRCPALSSVNVSNCPVLSRIDISSTDLQKLVLQKQPSLTTMTLKCLQLREVDLTECDMLNNSICKVFSNGGGCPMLNTLILDGCESLSVVELNSSSLIALSLVGCRATTDLKLECPNLQQLNLDGCDHLETASFSPVGLQSLNLGICPRLSKLQIEGPHISVLELKGCGVLSEAVINCPRLSSLDASFCSNLQDDCLLATTSSCRMIQSLILMSCPSIGPDGLFALKLLSNLTLLDLSYTFLTDLQPVFDSCSRLRILKLQACKCLLDTSLDALHKGGALPYLCELDLSYGSLCQSAIEKLLARCPHLTRVSLNGCTNMHDLDWGLECSQVKYDIIAMRKGHRKSFGAETGTDWMVEEKFQERRLQSLNCVGCPNIKKVVIPASAYCVHLASLNLSLSANLKDVELSCPNLAFLNLSNCTSLETLKLDCLGLTSLFLQSCGIDENEIESAIQSCHSLETLDVRNCPKVSPTGILRFRGLCPALKRLFNSMSV